MVWLEFYKASLFLLYRTTVVLLICLSCLKFSFGFFMIWLRKQKMSDVVTGNITLKFKQVKFYYYLFLS